MWGEDSIMCKVESEEEKREQLRRFLYQQAINGYQFHVNRYHTWMNYYSIFTGALFVGFCSLKTATTEISKTCSQAVSQCGCMNNKMLYELTNDYDPLIIVICILGFISSICWLLSLLGHKKWENNWMKNIEYYEDNNDDTQKGDYKSFILYKIINKNEKEKKFKALSTHYITIIFILSVISGWIFCLGNTTYYYCSSSYFCCLLIALSVTPIIVIIIMCICGYLYSDVSSKELRISKK